MSSIKRYNVNNEYAYSEMVEAGDFVFLTFCIGNVKGCMEYSNYGKGI